MPKESIDISRQWADNVCDEVEECSKAIEFWLNALSDAKTRTDAQNMVRWGKTYNQISLLILDLIREFGETPLKTPPV